jgi:hypothetical protein
MANLLVRSDKRAVYEISREMFIFWYKNWKVTSIRFAIRRSRLYMYRIYDFSLSLACINGASLFAKRSERVFREFNFARNQFKYNIKTADGAAKYDARR